MLAEASVVALAEDEGLRTVGGPICLVVELSSVPDNLWQLSTAYPDFKLGGDVPQA